MQALVWALKGVVSRSSWGYARSEFATVEVAKESRSTSAGSAAEVDIGRCARVMLLVGRSKS